MRIVHVNTEPTWRGGESQVFNLMLGLRRLGHESEAVTLPSSALWNRCREESIPAFELNMRADIDLIAAAKLADHLKDRPCDVLNAQTSRAHAIALLARKLGLRTPLVVTRRLDFPIRRYPTNLWKYRSKLVDRYIAVADVIRDILAETGVQQERITVINSSIDLRRFADVPDTRDGLRAELGMPEDALIVGNVAALAWHKGQKDLIAAMPEVTRAVPRAWCVIVGEGDERESLERLVRDAGGAARVILTGHRDDVPRILKAIDVFCMPSYYEGLCNSVLEAFAMKLPVVAARAGGLPEIVSDGTTGLLVPAHDPRSLAEGIKKLLTDASLAQRLAAGGHRLACERFGVDLMVERTLDLYTRLLAGRAKAARR
ncbi:MAG: glycosyltransferase family 4 protein [Acidobacteriota bacterium]